MQDAVHLLCWSGTTEIAEREVRLRYPDCEIRLLNKREFREQGSRGQFRTLAGLRGRALVFFFSSPADNRMPQVLAWSGVAHHCGETVLAAATGEWERYLRSDWPRMLPKAILSAICDVFVLAFAWVLLHLLKPKPIPIGNGSKRSVDLAYLFPFPLDEPGVGGASTHVRGFLSGLASIGGTVQIYSGQPFALDHFPLTIIRRLRRFYFFHELVTLSFNFGFAAELYGLLRKSPPRALYQRHRRFAIAGALLSRVLRLPLVLEFNGSEVWISQHWDPTLFPRYLTLCEQFCLSCASVIVVVSEVLQDDLVKRGIPLERIIVNPNGVDPNNFRPGCGGEQVREGLRFTEDDIVAGFVGTFSYWHGVEVLQKAILRLLELAEQDPVLDKVKFLLIGEGPLFGEMRKALAMHPRFPGRVVLAGSIAHGEVPRYLDAADILLSPHVPMPDGRRFFGSPTKLFEYMAMAKGIAASRLDQLAMVLESEDSALLITPGDSEELVAAIRRLATDRRLREHLGRRAREVVVANFTWERNAARVVARLRGTSPVGEADSVTQLSDLITRNT